MFNMRKNSLFNQYLSQAQTLADEITKLETKCLSLTTGFPNSPDLQQIVTESEKKFKDELLEKSPLAQTKEQQKMLYEEFKEKAINLYYDDMTRARDALLNSFSKLYIELRTLSSKAQEHLIKTLELKENAHNRDVIIRSGRLTDKISQTTDPTDIRLILALRKAYENLNQIAGHILFCTAAAFLFVPSEKTPEELSGMIYKYRHAMYKDTDDVELIKELCDSVEHPNTSSLNQYLETNPSSRHLSPQLLKETKTNLLLIEQLEKLALQSVHNAVSAIETARETDIKTFISNQSPSL